VWSICGRGEPNSKKRSNAVANKQKEYLVTDTSFFTVNSVPVIAEYRFQTIEEVKPQPQGGKFWKFYKAALVAFVWVWLILLALVIHNLISGH